MKIVIVILRCQAPYKMFHYKKKISTKTLDSEFASFYQQIKGLKIPKMFCQFILYSVSEIFTNIKEHSKAKNCSIVVEIGNKNCQIVVSDNGIGLRRSYILKKIYPKNDFSAIEFALSGLSTKELSERGFGLYTIRKLIESLDGKMMIESGKGLSSISKNRIKFSSIPTRKGVKVKLETPVRDINFYEIIK